MYAFEDPFCNYVCVLLCKITFFLSLFFLTTVACIVLKSDSVIPQLFFFLFKIIFVVQLIFPSQSLAHELGDPLGHFRGWCLPPPQATETKP